LPAYRYLVGEIAPASGNGLRDEIPFSTVKFGHVLNSPGGFSASIGLRHPKATRNNLDPGRTAIHIERDGTIVWSGILWTARAKVEDSTLELGGEGWWSYFRRRSIRVTKSYLAVDQLAIARDLINYAQAAGGGNIGVVVGAETSGRLRDRTWWYYERRNLASAVEELAAVEDGFEFAIDVAYNAAGTIVKTLVLSYPRRGRSTPLVWELGTNLEGLGQDVDATRAANLIDALGSGEGDSMLIATATDPGQLGTYPLLEDVVTFKDVSVVDNLQGKATLALANQGEAVMTIPTLLARQAGPDTAIGTFVTGDTVLVRGDDGWLSIDELMRIVAYGASVDENGQEIVSVSLAQERTMI
jgi:hypothetical protein